MHFSSQVTIILLRNGSLLSCRIRDPNNLIYLLKKGHSSACGVGGWEREETLSKGTIQEAVEVVRMIKGPKIGQSYGDWRRDMDEIFRGKITCPCNC